MLNIINEGDNINNVDADWIYRFIDRARPMAMKEICEPN